MTIASRPASASEPGTDADVLDPRLLATLRQRLCEQADELGAQIDSQRALLAQAVGDSGDTFVASSEGAAQAEEDDEAVSLLAHAQAELRAVHEALDRIEAGRYGRCVECGEPIAPARLQARPSARACLGCQAQDEREAARPDRF